MLPDRVDSSQAIAEGANNLLTRGAGLRAGESLLIVVEPPGQGYYQDDLADHLVKAATAIGAQPQVLTVPLGGGPDDIPAALLNGLIHTDRTVFLHRIGDQLRFSHLPGAGTKVISYTLDTDYLGADFARLPPSLLNEVQEQILDLLSRARRYTLRCRNGSRATMTLKPKRGARTTAFTIDNFPPMIIPPIDAQGLNGRLIFTHALTSTGIHEYEDAQQPLPSPLTVYVESGRIVELNGDAALTARIEEHIETIGARFGGDRRALYSWHTGINPTTFFNGAASDDALRWSGVAFGSPRYSHFHFCGHAPGEISGAIFDATICFDDQVIWRDGRLALFTPAQLNALAARHDVPAHILSTRLSIGISDCT